MSGQTINLHGDWQLARADGAYACVYAVPGDVHSALIAAGHIPDPYKGINEFDVRWVADEEWVASREFDWTAGAKTGVGMFDSWLLELDYLDTVAEVFVNGKSVLKAQNAFRPQSVILDGEKLVTGRNKIEIIFRSNTAAANCKQAEQPFPVPYNAGNCPLPNGNMLRKPQCHFGWDWNLAIAPFGLYGKATIAPIKLGQKPRVTVSRVAAEEATVLINSSSPITATFNGETKSNFSAAGHGSQFVSFNVPNPKLWWPAGSGDQHLYGLEIVENTGRTWRSKIGFRNIELISEVDDVGSRFAFRVNGREIFCRGANWIPADALPSRATPELTRKLLQAAVDANMNMIRVWGGGYYEQDWFYEICDELGLMVWQDFQFACHLYPISQDFFREVAQEVDYQVRRLQHHACMALWCGDNELLGALTWFKESRENRDRYLVAYDRLNRLVEAAAKQADPAINWWPSSPSPGILDFGDTWHDDSKGDMHFWSVWHEGRDFEHYYDVKPRFCSEFGFQSFPSLRLIKEFADSPDDLNISSAVMEHHQRNKGGNARIAETMFRNFRFPMDFGNFVYLSQIQHGLAMRMAVEYWRSLKPHCMGTLYWQLNDTWPVASWSGLDHGGSWKAMHYMARRFYAPVLVTARKAEDAFIVSAVSDLVEEFPLSLEVVAVAVSGETSVLYKGEVNLSPDAGRELTRIKLNDIAKERILFLNWTDEQGRRIRNHATPVAYKHLNLPNPSLATVVEEKGDVIALTVTAAQLALYVTAECDVAGHFSDNAFDLLPGESRTVHFTPNTPSDLTRAKQTLVIRDLYSSSH
jgi:beta-mannosidase